MAFAPGLALTLAASASLAAPQPGRYEATLCVGTATQPTSCGPASLAVGADGGVSVQVSDIVYRLRLRSGAAAVVVTQGATQIDEFDADAGWTGTTLRFVDADKQTRYEVRAGSRRHPK